MKFALLSAGVLALALSVPAIAAQPPVPADGLVLQGSNPKKPVTFNHSTHKTVECVVATTLWTARKAMPSAPPPAVMTT